MKKEFLQYFSDEGEGPEFYGEGGYANGEDVWKWFKDNMQGLICENLPGLTLDTLDPEGEGKGSLSQSEFERGADHVMDQIYRWIASVRGEKDPFDIVG